MALERRTERITLRLPESLREACELAAQTDQRSLSDWIVKTLHDAVGLSPGATREEKSRERRAKRVARPALRKQKSEQRRARRRGGNSNG